MTWNLLSDLITSSNRLTWQYLANVYLAEDWVDTGLPATIEGAVRSGYMAASAIAGARRRR